MTQTIKPQLLIILILLTCSCNYNLNQEAKSWNPYKTSEFLVFKSNNVDFDTIRIISVDRYRSNRNEIETVNCIMNGKRTFLMALTAWDNHTVLSINLNTDQVILDPFKAKRLSWLDSLPKTNLMVNSNIYTDVFSLTPDEENSNKRDEKSRVKTFYWSKSEGLLRYDTDDGIRWALLEKY